MLKLQVIGHLGRDAVMQQHGTDNVLNFSVAHTEKFKNAQGVLTEKTTWVECSWWVDGRSPVGQYLKKGTLIWAEGIPATRIWESKEGKKASSLVLRVFSLQLLGGKREGNQGGETTAQPAAQTSGGYTPYNSDEPPF
jgi:single-strand DNA-binding protein